MATPTRTRNRARTPEFKSKSDHARHLFRQGMSIADVTKTVPGMGYAFAYGIAQRLAKSDPKFNLRTVANPRAVKTVVIDRDAGTVTVQTKVGPKVINLTTGLVS